jgi:hypothetical protein
MAKQPLAPGSVVWLPCGLMNGIFPTERQVKIEVVVGDTGQTIFGFIPVEDVRPGASEQEGYVRAVVLRPVNGKVELVFRGEILSASNPVAVSREWLEKVGDREA